MRTSVDRTLSHCVSAGLTLHHRSLPSSDSIHKTTRWLRIWHTKIDRLLLKSSSRRTGTLSYGPQQLVSKFMSNYLKINTENVLEPAGSKKLVGSRKPEKELQIIDSRGGGGVKAGAIDQSEARTIPVVANISASHNKTGFSFAVADGL